MIRSDSGLLAVVTEDDTPTLSFYYDVSLNDQIGFPIDSYQKWTITVLGFNPSSGAMLSHEYQFAVSWYDDTFHFIGTGKDTPTFEERNTPETDDWIITISNLDEELQVTVVGSDTSDTYWTVTYKVLMASDQNDYV